jgi:hypothetical protein
MGRKRPVRFLITMIILSHLFGSTLILAEAQAETRVTITFAAGGVACGLYLFIHYSFRVSLSAHPYPAETAALVELGPEGWKIGFPSAAFMETERRSILGAAHTPEGLRMDLLRWRF